MISRRETFKQDDPTGICYFDIDGTLTTASGDPNNLVKACLSKNYAVGIITASKRTPEMVCAGSKSIQSWMPDSLCEYMNKNNFNTFNSNAPIIAGMNKNNPNFPNDYPTINYSKQWGERGIELGRTKGLAMLYGAKMLNIKDKSNVILFDDDSYFAKGVKQIDPSLTVVCAGAECSNNKIILTSNLVEQSIEL